MDRTAGCLDSWIPGWYLKYRGKVRPSGRLISPSRLILPAVMQGPAQIPAQVPAQEQIHLPGTDTEYSVRSAIDISYQLLSLKPLVAMYHAYGTSTNPYHASHSPSLLNPVKSDLDAVKSGLFTRLSRVTSL